MFIYITNNVYNARFTNRNLIHWICKYHNSKISRIKKNLTQIFPFTDDKSTLLNCTIFKFLFYKNKVLKIFALLYGHLTF